MDAGSSIIARRDALIDGLWVEADGGARFPVQDPATGATLGAVPDMGAQETRQAIEAAARAFLLWRATPAKERAAILRRWFTLILADEERLAQLITAEQGKPLAEARGEIAYAASYIDWFAEEGRRVYGDVLPVLGGGGGSSSSSSPSASSRRSRRGISLPPCSRARSALRSPRVARWC